MTEVRRVIVLGGGWVGWRGHEGAFWIAGSALYLDLGGGYMGTYL